MNGPAALRAQIHRDIAAGRGFATSGRTSIQFGPTRTATAAFVPSPIPPQAPVFGLASVRFSPAAALTQAAIITAAGLVFPAFGAFAAIMGLIHPFRPATTTLRVGAQQFRVPVRSVF